MNTSGEIVVLDNGGTRIRVGHLANREPSEHFRIHSSARLCVPDARGELLGIINEYCREHALKPDAVVLGMPAVLDRHNDVVSHCNNIPQLEGAGLAQYLSDNLGCHVVLEQDIMLQLIGEWHCGCAGNRTRVAGVYFGTGIGSAYLIDGDPHNPLVQDIQAGHIPVMAQGRLCKCGNRDCVEAYACGHTLTDLAQRTGCPVASLFHLRHKNQFAPALDVELTQFVMFQAFTLATVGTLLTPELIVVGGGIPQMMDYPRQELIDTARRHLQKPYPSDSIEFVWARLGSQAPLYGALALLDREMATSIPSSNQLKQNP